MKCKNCSPNKHNRCDNYCEFYDIDDACYHEFVYVDDNDRLHCLDGPSYIIDTTGEKWYWIHGFHLLLEEDYWNHSDVKAYIYLKLHPELEGFI